MPRPRHTVSGITGGAKAYFLARLFVECGVSLVVVTPDAHQRDVLYDDLKSLLAGMPDAPPHWQGLESVVCRYLPQARWLLTSCFPATSGPGIVSTALAPPG
jgi:hypothetical protein